MIDECHFKVKFRGSTKPMCGLAGWERERRYFNECPGEDGCILYQTYKLLAMNYEKDEKTKDQETTTHRNKGPFW